MSDSSTIETACLPLMPAQEGMLFEMLAGGSDVNIEQIDGLIEHELDQAALRKAWSSVMTRHEVLRASFVWEEEDGPGMRVHPRGEAPIFVLDWSELPPDAVAHRWEALRADERARPFDLSTAPLFRVVVARTSGNAWRMLWTFPHLILDGRSFAAVLRDVFDYYDALRGGESPATHPAPRYTDYLAWRARLVPSAESRSYWSDRLRGARSPTFPATPPEAGAPHDRAQVDVRLSAEETEGLRALASSADVTLGTLIHAAWAHTLGRFSEQDDVLYGEVRASRHGTVPAAEQTAGVFLSTLPVRTRMDPDRPVREWLREMRAAQLDARDHEHVSLVDLQRWSEVAPGAPLLESILVFDRASLGAQLSAPGGRWANRHFELHERTGFPLTGYAYGDEALWLKIAFDRDRMSQETGQGLLDLWSETLRMLPAFLDGAIADLPAAPAADVARIRSLSGLVEGGGEDACVHTLIERQVARSPNSPAVSGAGRTLTYSALDDRATRLAAELRSRGVGQGTLVGVCMERAIELPLALLAIHKAGGAYVPLDPEYPRDRLHYMVEDSGLDVLVADAAGAALFPARDLEMVRIDAIDWEEPAPAPPSSEAEPEDLAYVIYTSGSTGRPKGVMVEHRNVTSFFRGMDERIGTDPGVWLAVTSLSFDISVLELLWTLTRGFEVVLYREDDRKPAVTPNANRGIDFSLFYFASDEGAPGTEKYRLLLEGAKFADRNGFSAVWTPERHFHAFGGLYPNPSVVSAAVAAVTERIGIRAGSVVLPLHHPVRVAEEWSVVDNLSGGRVGLSVASGWQPNDFLIRPESYAERKDVMLRDLDTLRSLWRGEKVAFPGARGDEVTVGIHPRPVQAELPVWLTAAGNPETFRAAGEKGANLLTHLLGQTAEEVSEKVAIYREAWRAAGHPGEGHVTLMLHTFVGDDDEYVRETVRAPMTEYLRSSLSLVKGYADAWTAYKRKTDGSAAGSTVDLESLGEEEMDALLAYSFERYYETSSLFGTPDRCARMIDQVKGLGVDEIACLIDFGLPHETVLDHLGDLAGVRALTSAPAPTQDGSDDGSVAGLIRRHGVTHLQCTPSMATMLLADDAARNAFADLQMVMLGGEAFSLQLATAVREATDAAVLNMYGPTETTIWSSTHRLNGERGFVPLGEPIRNTELRVLDPAGRNVPLGVPGELYIGGHGVVRGYLNRSELTAERFVDLAVPGGSRRFYRTGDRVRWRSDGRLEFLGRTDFQVKIRGHRIELGEIESALATINGVKEAVVVARTDLPGDARLAAYLIPEGGRAPSADTLRKELRDRLPEFMVPSVFVVMEVFPLTPNFKIDRKALPSPQAERAAGNGRPASPPSNEVERIIAAIWMEVLGEEAVGTDDNFFDIGGHSLLAVQVHGKLRAATGRSDLTITDLFRFPTVRALAAHLGSDGAAEGATSEAQDRGARRREMMKRRRGQ